MPETPYTAIGLMSGTSLDGIDVALIKTDGRAAVQRLDSKFFPYDDDLRAALYACLGKSSDENGFIAETEKRMTQAHIDAVNDFGKKADVVGFHGQTIFHDPAHRTTWQIGDGEMLAKGCGMPVVYDFRTADVKAGGQGAPLLPLYHQVLTRSAKLETPIAILNIGGVSNVTWIGEEDHDVLAFDTGPGNALMDDWMRVHYKQNFDKDGAVAASGVVHQEKLDALMAHPYFAVTPPKSLDRDNFAKALEILKPLLPEDGMATLAEFTAAAIVQGFSHMPQKPNVLYVTGGGRLNVHLMKRLIAMLDMPVASVDAIGWNGDAMEAEGFAYLAVRSLLGKPLSLPTTTGCPEPITGGKRAPA